MHGGTLCAKEADTTEFILQEKERPDGGKNGGIGQQQEGLGKQPSRFSVSLGHEVNL